MSGIDVAARSYLGVPWVHQGRSRHGLDCVGLAVVCLRDIGLDPPDRADYGRDPDGTLRAVISGWDALSPVASPEPGDIALIRYKAERHIAIVGQQPQGLSLIHADSRAGKVVEHLMDDRWRKRVVAAWRIA